MNYLFFSLQCLCNKSLTQPNLWRGRRGVCLGFWNPGKRPESFRVCYPRKSASHVFWEVKVQPYSEGLVHPLWTQSLCSHYRLSIVKVITLHVHSLKILNAVVLTTIMRFSWSDFRDVIYRILLTFFLLKTPATNACITMVVLNPVCFLAGIHVNRRQSYFLHEYCFQIEVSCLFGARIWEDVSALENMTTSIFHGG